MATIFSGERLKNVFQLVDDCFLVASPYNFYQVPAGRYAKVTVHHAQFGSGATHNAAFLFFGDIPFNHIGGNNSIYSASGGANEIEYFNSSGDLGGTFADGVAMRGGVEFLMTTGQTITKTTASGSAGTGHKIWITVQEFVNP